MMQTTIQTPPTIEYVIVKPTELESSKGQWVDITFISNKEYIESLSKREKREKPINNYHYGYQGNITSKKRNFQNKKKRNSR
jgi:hypothetical protein